MEKVKWATVLGTMQSTLTEFKNLREFWGSNTREERLLGVSLTGICDNAVMNGSKGKETLEEALKLLRRVARSTNKEWAEKLGVPASAAITTVKPSGTVSQLVDSASGIHPRHARHYIRRVRNDKKDPLSTVMIESGVPHEDDVYTSGNSVVFSFPIKTGEDTITREDFTAIQFLELWRSYKKHWTDHNPSVTVSVKQDEWQEVGQWVWDNWEDVGGLSFLPHSEHTYTQAPYEEVSEDIYRLVRDISPDEIRWDLLEIYEKRDMSEGQQTLACSAGVCEI